MVGHGHAHGHQTTGWVRVWAGVRHAVTPHRHDAADMTDSALEASRRGMRALWISFGALTVTAVAQAVLVALTGSVALLGDTLHNFADALTAVPLGIAFLLGRRPATRRFTYGLGRAEDLAGLVIILVITSSAVLAAWQAVDRLVDPRDMTHVGWVAAAGVVGFAGNELVGRRIGSAALVADGLHARTDGFTSLAVLVAAGGAALDWQWVDPVVGLAISIAIITVLWGAAREVFGRMLDAVDPELTLQAERLVRGTVGVHGAGWVRLRWHGHALAAEVDVEVDPALTVTEAHVIAHDVEHRLIHGLPRLERATVHTHPSGDRGAEQHELLAHHRD
jgi:cation diffusion facilitator family transporter